MKLTKKALSVILSILVILSVFALSVSAAECDHESLSGVVVVRPTCSSTGVKKVHCDVCNQDVLLDLERAEHLWEPVEEIAPTYNSVGSRKLDCINCDAVTYVSIPATVCEHWKASWGEGREWRYVIAPTCTEKGTEQTWCETCKKMAVREVPATGHMEKTIIGDKPTCTERGKTDGSWCIVCDTWVTPQYWIESTGHVFYTVADEKQPECIVTGKGHIYCSNEGCTYAESCDIPSLGHTDKNGDGKCEVCGDIACRCFCHKDTFFAKIVRYLNTLINSLLGENKFMCCDCMDPLESL